jgi:hypothetical protein
VASAIDLRAGADRRASAEDAVRDFFAALFAGRNERARRFVSDGFSWFGSAIDDAAWRRRAAARPVEVSRLRALTSEATEILRESSVSESLGALEAGDQIVLADLLEDEETTTVAVIAECDRCSTPRIRRVVDPTTLAGAIRAIRSLVDADPDDGDGHPGA